MKKNQILATCSLLAGMVVLPEGVWAQQRTEAAGADSTQRFFNALDHRLQRRFVPEGRKVHRVDAGKNFSVSVLGGGLKIKGGLPLVYQGGVALSKQVSPFNTYRLSLMGGGNERFKQVGLEVDHLFNLSDYLAGYRAGAHWNLYTVWGLGGYLGKTDGMGKDWAASLHGGVQLAYHVSGHWDWYVEPKVYLLTDGSDGMDCEKKYDLGYGVVTGLTYRFTGWPVAPKSEDAGDNLFIEAGVGLKGDFSSRVREPLSGLQPMGPVASLSLGKWFMPLGVRATAFGSLQHTVSPEGDKTKEVLAGGRLEAMVNLNTLLKPSVTDPRLEVNVAGGYEFGALAHKSPAYAKSARWFHGPTGAVQLVYFTSPQIGVFGEARYSMNDYSQPFKEAATQDRTMKNLSVMFGVQYRRKKEIFDSRKGLFVPYNFVYGSLGLNAAYRSGISLHHLDEVLGQQVNLGFGRQLSPVSAVRGGLEIGHYQDPRKEVYPLTLSADYLLNLTNMIDNYNEGRIFNLSAFAGVVFTHHNQEQKNYLGVQGGLQQEFNLTDRWGIYLEEYLRMYKGKITPSARVFTTKELSLVGGMNVGVKFRL